MQLLRSGDAVSWEGLYTRMYQSMVSYASRRLPAEEARDAQRRSSRGVSALHRSAAASVDWTGVDDGLISDEEESGVRDAFEQLSARDQEVLEPVKAFLTTPGSRRPPSPSR